MHLTPSDRELLEGARGSGAQLAMELVVAAGKASGAERLIDISGSHIDGCLFHGLAGLHFAERLVQGSARVSVPTTLNVSSLDLLHPDLYRGDPEEARRSRELMDAYVAMGCLPTWTCAPYQLPSRPDVGEQVAWGESNAIVFANSVLGARTERYGDFLDICCAITGRAPYVGLHTDTGRRATIQVDLKVEPGDLDEELLYPLLGHVLGKIAGNEVTVITGLDDRAGEDGLKAVGAAAASSGAVALFHAVGVTPEAPTLEAAISNGEVERRVKVGREDLRAALAELTTGSGRLAAVSVGTPHASLREIHELAALTRAGRSAVPFYVNTSRDILSVADSQGLVEALVEFGATIVTDTCTYVTPIIDEANGVVMTNSGKWAYYAPANLGVEVAMGSLADCVDSAVSGEVRTSIPW